MPELPEVETVVRQLSRDLPGRRIGKVTVFHADLLNEPAKAFAANLSGKEIQSVGRRGKNILISFSDSGVLAVNLGMTGKLLFRESPRGSTDLPESPVPPHLGVRFDLDPPPVLYYADTRRFGSLRRFTEGEWSAESARLGPEPLDPDLTAQDFLQSLARSRSPIRSWLLDQTRIAGVGNIYACEALFRAGIHPQAPARSLDSLDAERLLLAIRAVLSDAIRARGTTLRDYRTAMGDEGGFGPALQAYGQEGTPCPRCNTAIVRVVFGNRSAFFCPGCQPRE